MGRKISGYVVSNKYNYVTFQEDYTYSTLDIMETWRGLEDAVSLGLAKSIGVSNFNIKQMERLVKEAKLKPAVLQIEVGHLQCTESQCLTEKSVSVSR